MPLDMAVAPLPLSACSGRVIALGPTSGLPTLPDYVLGLLFGDEPIEAVNALADHLRASLVDDGVGREPAPDTRSATGGQA